MDVFGTAENKHIIRMKKATYGDDDEEVGKRAPKGHFVIYVGGELRRFVLHISYLKNPCFQKLLEEAAQEFGFRSPKGIVLPCDECTFQKILWDENIIQSHIM
ncbi:hypothetical protein RND71_000463 [Anisodus tanguticus]|uniref:Small auxin up regulated protein n=1 Tax=Anisodus tanguticus TaxID=243964 RepID=A0AAE1SZG4_9SOLA|nr:hypothetical protein RND71_000463 [Anisodus tanguticus]